MVFFLWCKRKITEWELAYWMKRNYSWFCLLFLFFCSCVIQKHSRGVWFRFNLFLWLIGWGAIHSIPPHWMTLLLVLSKWLNKKKIDKYDHRMWCIQSLLWWSMRVQYHPPKRIRCSYSSIRVFDYVSLVKTYRGEC